MTAHGQTPQEQYARRAWVAAQEQRQEPPPGKSPLAFLGDMLHVALIILAWVVGVMLIAFAFAVWRVLFLIFAAGLLVFVAGRHVIRVWRTIE